MMTWSMACNIRTVPEIDIGSFPQGISIHTPDNIFGLKAQWTVLVLLQKPTPDPRINSIIHHLKNIVSSNNVPLDSAIKRNWIRRLRWISEVIQVNKVTRSKRSILPFVGSLSNILFGTVTEDQLNQYRKAVNRALTSTNQTIHIVNSLITVTKHIQLQAKENQHRITNFSTKSNLSTKICLPSTLPNKNPSHICRMYKNLLVILDTTLGSTLQL